MKVFVYTKRRRENRFKPEPTNPFAHIDSVNIEGKFHANLIGLVLDQSAQGCGLVFQSQNGFEIGEICRIKIGSYEPVQAEVRWKQKLDDSLIKVGFRFL